MHKNVGTTALTGECIRHSLQSLGVPACKLDTDKTPSTGISVRRDNQRQTRRTTPVVETILGLQCYWMHLVGYRVPLHEHVLGSACVTRRTGL